MMGILIPSLAFEEHVERDWYREPSAIASHGALQGFLGLARSSLRSYARTEVIEC